MECVLRTACALLALAPIICAAADREPGDDEAARQAVTRAVESRPGFALTVRQKLVSRQPVDDAASASPRKPALAGAARSSQMAPTAQTAPLLPPTWIDDDRAIDAIAAGDVTGDLRTDIVALGPQASPNNTERQLTVYVQSADGFFEAPIHSPVISQSSARPAGVAVRPVFGARPNVVVWGGFWIEIYAVGVDGSALPTPVTIAPGLAIRDVVIRDLNADGRLDFIVSGSDTNDVDMPTVVRRYIQTSAASFTAGTDAVIPVTAYGAVGTLADVDGDGITDVLDGVSGVSFGFAYRRGLADGTFGAEVAVLETASDFASVGGVFVRDVDGDGRPDVILAAGNGTHVRFQTAPGAFTNVQLPASGGNNVHHVSTGDLDGNGLLDAVVWIDGYDVMQVVLQTAPRVFTAAGEYGVESGGSFPSFYEDTTLIADVNSDARADLLVLAAGLSVFYNSTGTYPVLDAWVTSSATVDDSGPVAHVLWRHEVRNAGPATLDDALLLQNVPPGYELSGHSVPCTYFVTTVACSLPPMPAGAWMTVVVEAVSVAARNQDGRLRSEVLISVGGHPIDAVPGNNAVEVIASVLGHPESLQAAGDRVFVYEGSGNAVVPVITSPGTSSLARCMDYVFFGNNAADGTGIAGATNGQVCTAPGQRSRAHILVSVRDGTSANAALDFNLAFSTGGFSAPGTQNLTIVDDDGSDPKLTALGAQPFEEWPAVFSSIATLRERTADAWFPEAAAIGDLDGDGRNDLAVSFSVDGRQPASVLVWLQGPDGTLSPPLKWSGSFSGKIASLAIGDVIGDSAAELVVPLYTELDFLRVVNGRLELVSSVIADGWKAAVGDLNGDGYADIVLADGETQSFDGPEHWAPNVTVFRGNAARTLDPAPYELAMPYAGRNQVVLGRFNDDALLDIAISSGQGNFPSVSIAYQNDDETFAPPVGVWIAGPMHLDGFGFGDTVTTGDFDGDGTTDLAIGSYVGDGLPSVWVYTDLREDDLSSPSQRLYVGPEGSLGALDLDHDGHEDLLADNSVFPGSPASPMKFFLQDAARQLRYAGTLAAFGSGRHELWTRKMAVGDLDGDGGKDAVLLNHYSGIVALAHSAPANQAVQFTVLESSATVAGARARYRVRIANNGARRSLEIPLDWSLPPQLGSAQIVAAKGGCYVAAATAQCLLPQLDPGGYVDVMLTGTFDSSGTYPMTLSAGPGGAYGGSTLTVTVTAPSNGGGSSAGGGGGGSSGGGGGGALGWLSVAALLGLASRRRGARAMIVGVGLPRGIAMTQRFVLLLAAALVLPLLARAQHDTHSAGAATEKLGTVDFANSCAPELRADFNRAVALLHSFEFLPANEGFTAVLARDASCAIAHWGIALSYWGNPFAGARSPAALAQGLAAVQKARATGSPTPRERAFIAAAGALFDGYETASQRERVLAYERAMAEVARANSSDIEAQIFYALAVNQTALPTDQTYAAQLRAAGILEPLYAEHPDHPGLAHYIIHAYDHPPLAARALAAARRYASIAPSAPHALHMPSHTFTRVGSWQESAATNQLSEKTALQNGVATEALHAMDYQTYAYLQMAQDGAARAVLDRMPPVAALFDASATVGGAAPPIAGFYALAAMPARYALERGAWQDAAELKVPSAGTPFTIAIAHFARALGAARSGRAAAAGADVAALAALRDRLKGQDDYWAGQVDIQWRAAGAWIAFAEGRRAEALAAMSAAADIEDATDKAAVTPGPLAPARELLGEMQLEAGDAPAALRAFEATMAKEPGRFRGALGAARAAEAAGDAASARKHYARVLEIASDADTARPELERARRYLAAN